MNSFSCKRFVLTMWSVPISRDLARAWRLACGRSRGVWGWLWFLCGMVHCGRGLIVIFRDFFASINKIFHFSVGSGDWAIILWVLDAFLIFPNFLRLWLKLFGKSWDYSYIIFISNNRASFHLWWKENLLKHPKSLKISWQWLLTCVGWFFLYK